MSDYKKISASPTNPGPGKQKRAFDAADVFDGPIASHKGATEAASGLDEKLRKAYFWITNTAIISPFYDIEYEDGPSSSYTFGDSKTAVTLPSGQSYSSFVLLPLLNLIVRRRCLIVGGPGRGKTATAVLMGIIAGYSLADVRRAIQHGQPQMTITDLLGNPLPKDMVNAESMDTIRISWRKWLSMRVKIIDEYNRIPTRTQSALLTVLADNYAELLDHIYECPEAAWYLTANDDAGGGTYQVIEALKDRIDVVIRALHFNTRFVSELLSRIENNFKPEQSVPPEIIFTEAEIDAMNAEILTVAIDPKLRKRMEFFCRQFEFFEPSSASLEYMTKDTAKLSGIDFTSLTAKDGGKDAAKNLGSQTMNGVSVRKLMTLFVFCKAAAYFRGSREVSLADVRQILPFVFHETLVPHLEAPFFELDGNGPLKVDRISWLRRLFDLSNAEYDRIGLDDNDIVVTLLAEFSAGLEGVPEKETRARIARIERTLADWSKAGKLYAHLADDILTLKYLHQRYTNYLRWQTWQ